MLSVLGRRSGTVDSQGVETKVHRIIMRKKRENGIVYLSTSPWCNHFPSLNPSLQALSTYCNDEKEILDSSQNRESTRKTSTLICKKWGESCEIFLNSQEVFQ